MIELNQQQVNAVDGGILPVLMAFGAGYVVGKEVGEAVVTFLDAIDVI